MSSAPTAALLLVAAGPGSRLGANRPKALAELAGRSILDHALDSVSNPAAAALFESVVVVAPASHLDEVKRLVARRIADGAVVAGGRERQDSVRAGLDACADFEIVAVHDAARPFVPPATLAAAIAAASDHGAAVAALPAVDTVKIVDDDRFVAATPPRDRVWLAQTPQAFRREVLVRAHAAASDSLSTDDAALVEKAGGRVQIVSGDPLTRKITTADDLRWAEWVLASGQWPR